MSHSPAGSRPEIKIRLKLHGPFPRLLGGTDVEVLVPARTTGAGLLRFLADRYPGFRDHLPPLETDEVLHGNILVTRGQEVLRLGDVLRDGETIRIYTALAGG